MENDKLLVGDFVWCYSPAKKKGISSKLQRRWTGPFLIIDVLSDCVYRIQKNPKSKPKVVHRDRLIRYHGRDAHNWLQGSKSDTEQVKDSTTHLPVLPETPIVGELDGTVNGDVDVVVSDIDENVSDINEINPDQERIHDLDSIAVSEFDDTVDNGDVTTSVSDQWDTVIIENESRRPRRAIKSPKRYGDWTV